MKENKPSQKDSLVMHRSNLESFHAHFNNEFEGEIKILLFKWLQLNWKGT